MSNRSSRYPGLDDDEKRSIARRILSASTIPPPLAESTLHASSLWTRDLVLDDDIDPSRATPAGNAHEAAFVTGTSGYLGAFVLHELCCRTPGPIHCLVRASSPEQALQRIKSNLERYLLWDGSLRERIVPVIGDLAKPKLGLSPQAFADLGDAIDVVYHLGAGVNFLFSYADLREANVLGTKEVLRFASTGRQKPVHLVSTYGVFLTPGYSGRVVREEEMPKWAPSGGYGETKWVSERLVHKARRRGFQVSMYRPPFVGWDMKTGVFNSKDFVTRLILGSLQVKQAPDIPLLFDITPVGVVSHSMVEIALRAPLVGRNYNQIVQPGFRWLELIAALQSEGREVAVVPYGQWRSAILSDDDDNPMRTLMPALPERLEDAGHATYAHVLHETRVPSRFENAGLVEWAGATLPPPSSARDLVKPLLARLAATSVSRAHAST